MFGSRVEDRFVNDAAVQTGGGRGVWALLVVIGLGMAAFFAWAWLYEIEEVTRATGKVVPSRQLQVVQSLEGGIVAALQVREGDLVHEGDELARIDDTSAGSDLGELREREAALMAAEARVEAEAAGSDTIAFSDDLANRAPAAVAAETQVFLSRQKQLLAELSVLDDQLAQREAAFREATANVSKLEAQLAPLREETELTEGLVESGSVPRVEFLRLQGDLAQIGGELDISRARIPGIEASIREAQNQIASAQSSYVLTAREKGAEISGELAILREAMRAADDRLTRTSLRAPVLGTVNRLHVTTIGAVVQPGAPIVEIVPRDDQLLVEAQINPRDVAFIRPGHPASVKITAYDFLVYGALDGTVERIGADALTDPEGNQYFQVMVRTEESALPAASEGTLPISPGMVAQVDIQTGRKTVMDYLLRPLRRAQAEALRER
ncbi:MAG: HlyD family type I secretion periplasmic adaptor subunit [Pseudomonadota bacterium]